MKIFGKPTIHPALFFSGKVMGYVLWVLLLLSLLGVEFFVTVPLPYENFVVVSLVVLSLLIILLSSINLGSSISLGLPEEESVLKTKGIYQISRNPMYVGFDVLTIASVIGNWNPVTLLLGIYTLLVYHFIILGEEKFLKERFGDTYQAYQLKVRRYV